jgi:hypothetical protein
MKAPRRDGQPGPVRILAGPFFLGMKQSGRARTVHSDYEELLPEFELLEDDPSELLR